MKKKLLIMLVAALLAVPTTILASVSDDQVTSIKLKEADNNGSQDTNSGSGVKTGHIQDYAVTNQKIDGGAVTDDKISGTISASKIATDGLNADMVDGLHESEFARSSHAHPISDVSSLQTSLDGKSDVSHRHPDLQKKSSNVITVANTGGDYSDLVTAINSITDASVNNRYLLKLMPGTYYVENSVTIDTGVDVIGSGVENTKIICNNGSFVISDESSFTNMTLVFNVNTTSGIAFTGLSVYCKNLHNINVKANIQSDTSFRAIDSGSVDGIEFEDINIDITSSNGTVYGVLFRNNKAIFKNCTINISGTSETNQASGINGGGEIFVKNTEINISGANDIYSIVGYYYYLEISNSTIVTTNSGSSHSIVLSGHGIVEARIDNSTIISSSEAIYAAPGAFVIANTKVGGMINFGYLPYSVIRCVNVYNEYFDLLNGSCQ